MIDIHLRVFQKKAGHLSSYYSLCGSELVGLNSLHVSVYAEAAENTKFIYLNLKAERYCPCCLVLWDSGVRG